MAALLQLLGYIALFFDVSFRSLSLILRLSFTVGQYIVHSILAIVSCFRDFVDKVSLVLEVLYEDYCIFIVDLVGQLSWFVSCISYILQSVYTKIMCCGYTLIRFGSSICSAVTWFINTLHTTFAKVIGIVAEIPNFIKHCIVIVGSAVWLILQVIPLGIVYALSLMVYCAGRSFEEVYSFISFVCTGIVNSFLNTILTFSEIPLQALLGMLLGVGIFYSLYKYHNNLMCYTLLCANHLYNKLRHCVNTIWILAKLFFSWLFGIPQNQQVQIVGQVHNDQRPSSSANPVTNNTQHHYNTRQRTRTSTVSNELSHQLNLEVQDRLCVVCQDQEKCVIVLPCRHLCMCTECSVMVKQQQGVCPMCRQDVRTILKVYV